MTSKNDNDVLTRTARVLKLHETPTTKSYDYAKLTIPVDMLLFDSYDAKSSDFAKTKKLYAVAPLGRGGNGDVWFAIAADPDDAEVCSTTKIKTETSKHSGQNLVDDTDDSDDCSTTSSCWGSTEESLGFQYWLEEPDDFFEIDVF
jgi:hypothetical protein